MLYLSRSGIKKTVSCILKIYYANNHVFFWPKEAFLGAGASPCVRKSFFALTDIIRKGPWDSTRAAKPTGSEGSPAPQLPFPIPFLEGKENIFIFKNSVGPTVQFFRLFPEKHDEIMGFSPEVTSQSHQQNPHAPATQNPPSCLKVAWLCYFSDWHEPLI